MWFVANKTLVRSFYLQHTGFFLFLFIVFFGIVAPSQQLAYQCTDFGNPGGAGLSGPGGVCVAFVRGEGRAVCVSGAG